MSHNERLIITAASSSYGPSVLALLGSLNLNWPQHPRVRVYDIGLDKATLDVLADNQVEVVTVPPFCSHWRKYYTWKLWCLNDAPARDILWIDAGVIVLQPLDEIFEAIDAIGYFLVSHYQLLDWEASENACRGCGVAPEFRLGKTTLVATIMGFRKQGKTGDILKEALEVGLVEEYIKATTPAHRFEQAIISLLMYKYVGHVIISDGVIYAGSSLPNQLPGRLMDKPVFQTPLLKTWVHRRTVAVEDSQYLAAHITQPGPRFVPHEPYAKRKKTVRFDLAVKIAIYRTWMYLERKLRWGAHSIFPAFPKKVNVWINDGVRD